MMSWQTAKQSLDGFGGQPTTLYVRKTGLPFFDALLLYGAIDVTFRVSGETSISDEGVHWRIEGLQNAVNARRLEKLIDAVRIGLDPKPKAKTPILASDLEKYLRSRNAVLPQTGQTFHQGKGALSGLDAVLQSGMRGVAAKSYETLQSGQTSAKECLTEIGIFDGILAVAGALRTDSIGDLVFLPIFEGKVDFSKIVSPLRAWLGIPTPICAQALMLLALENSLFSEGYETRLSAIVYNRRVARGEFAYSGVLSVNETALSQSAEQTRLTSETISHLYSVYRRICTKAWNRGQSTEFTQDALAMAYWIIHPHVRKNLRSLITSQERLAKHGLWQLFSTSQSVEEVFYMTHGNDIKVDHDECRKFAKAVASGIYHARIKNAKEPKKAWYDEVTLLRSATRASQFFRRALILVEQGRRESPWVGSSVADEDFDPSKLEHLYRQRDTRDFEMFRDLFRMHLIQQSSPRTGSSSESPEDSAGIESPPITPEVEEQPE